MNESQKMDVVASQYKNPERIEELLLRHPSYKIGYHILTTLIDKKEHYQIDDALFSKLVLLKMKCNTYLSTKDRHLIKQHFKALQLFGQHIEQGMSYYFNKENTEVNLKTQENLMGFDYSIVFSNNNKEIFRVSPVAPFFLMHLKLENPKNVFRYSNQEFSCIFYLTKKNNIKIFKQNKFLQIDKYEPLNFKIKANNPELNTQKLCNFLNETHNHLSSVYTAIKYHMKETTKFIDETQLDIFFKRISLNNKEKAIQLIEKYNNTELLLSDVVLADTYGVDFLSIDKENSNDVELMSDINFFHKFHLKELENNQIEETTKGKKLFGFLRKIFS